MGKGGGSGSSKGEVRYDVVQEPGGRPPAPSPAPAPAHQTSSSVPSVPSTAPIVSPSSSPAESPSRIAFASRSASGSGHSHTASLQFPPVPSELPFPVLFPSASAVQAQAASATSASSSPASSDGPPAAPPAPAVLQNTTSFPSLRDWGDARIPISGPLSSPSVRLWDNPADAPSAAALLPPLPQSAACSPWAPVSQGPPPPLPPGWAFQIDPASGFPFFYNAGLRLSQWEDPRGRGWGLPDPASQQGEEAAQAPSGSPLDWPLPPGWQQIEDPTSGRLYFVNYDAQLLLDTDPRVLIAASARPAEAVPVDYPPPWTDVPVHVPATVQRQGEASSTGEPSWRPCPPAPVPGRRPSLWWKLGHGYGGSRPQVPAAGSRTNFLLLNTQRNTGEIECGTEEEEKKKQKKKTKFKFKARGEGGSSTSSSNSSGSGSGDEGSGDGPIWGLTGPLLADEVAQELGELLGQSVGGSDSNEGNGSFGAGGGSDDDGPGSGSEHHGDGGDVGDGLEVTGLETILAYAGAGPRDLPGGGRGGGGAGGGVGSGGGRREECLASRGWDGPDYGSQKNRKREKRVASGFAGELPWAVISVLLGILASLLLWVLRVVPSRCRSEGNRSFRVSRVWKSAAWKGRRTGFKCKFSLPRMGKVVSSLCIKLQTGYYQHLFEHQPAKLRVLTALDGAAPLYSQLPHRRREITIVTQASADRLQAIEAMASSWQGALCVAVHVRTRGELQQVYRTMCNLHARVEGTGQCRLHMCIAMEVGLPDDAAAMAALYPVNSMRNIALRMATTELVFLLDADFVPCPGLHDRLTNKACYNKILRDAKHNKKMFVVAAFESRTSHRRWKESLPPCQMPRTFEELRKMWHRGLVQGFHCGHFPRGHQPTDYSRFFNHVSTKPYSVQFREYYEPYVICARKSVPFFDERFRGYGLNKISHSYHCAITGMTFSVLPRQYVWEFPHPRSEAWIRTFGVRKDPNQVLRVQGLYTRFKDELLADHPSSSSTILNSTTMEILATTVRWLVHLFYATQQGLEKFVVPSPWSLNGTLRLSGSRVH